MPASTSTVCSACTRATRVIRNAGGVVTQDELRSLAISQRLLGRTEILLVHPTDCGMLTFTDDGFRQQIESDTGVRPTYWSCLERSRKSLSALSEGIVLKPSPLPSFPSGGLIMHATVAALARQATLDT